MAMSYDQALELGVYVLNTLQHPAKTSEIASEAVSPRMRAYFAQHGTDVSSYLGDEIALAAVIGKSFAHHQAKASAAKQAVVKSRGLWALGPGAQALLQATSQDLQKPADSQYTGLVGEYAVISELLASDWNAAKFPHDDGVDVVATRGDQMRTVQVKTAHGTGRGHRTFTFQVKKLSHDRYDGVKHYYVLVMRRMLGSRLLNDFMILNTHDLNHLLIGGDITLGEGGNFRIAVQVDDAEYRIGERDMTPKVNRFRTLFR